MAFPGELNLNYYKGDTQEFRIYPKQNDGSSFNMSGYTIKFSIADTRGSLSVIECYAVVDENNPNMAVCAIRPADGAQLTAGTQYVYDVEIKKISTPYDLVYTILTGTVTVTEQVTQG
ncbi:MAG: hypothetical protein ACKOXF_07100 [Chitinophagaceae bacterium]